MIQDEAMETEEADKLSKEGVFGQEALSVVSVNRLEVFLRHVLLSKSLLDVELLKESVFN